MTSLKTCHKRNIERISNIVYKENSNHYNLIKKADYNKLLQNMHKMFEKLCNIITQYNIIIFFFMRLWHFKVCESVLYDKI